MLYFWVQNTFWPLREEIKVLPVVLIRCKVFPACNYDYMGRPRNTSSSTALALGQKEFKEKA